MPSVAMIFPEPYPTTPRPDKIAPTAPQTLKIDAKSSPGRQPEGNSFGRIYPNDSKHRYSDFLY